MAWTPVDLEAVLHAGIEARTPSCLYRRDGAALLYRGKLNVIFGEPESGKTWVALFVIAERIEEAIRSGRDEVVAVFLDYEDDAQTYLSRLHSAGVAYGDVDRYTRYYSVDEAIKTAPADLEGLDTADIVVVDATNSAMTAAGLDPLSNADALEFIGGVRRLRLGTSAAWLLLDHEPISTSKQRRQALGAQSKLAAVDGAQFRATAKEQPRPGGRGIIELRVTKDRPGAVRRISGRPKKGIQHAATITMKPRGSDPDCFDWKVEEPEGVEVHTGLRDAILGVDYGGEFLSKTKIRHKIRENGWRGSNELINRGIDEAANRGELEVSTARSNEVYRPASHQSRELGQVLPPTQPDTGDRSAHDSGESRDTATKPTSPGPVGDNGDGSPIPRPPPKGGTGRDKPGPGLCAICGDRSTPGMLGGIRYCTDHIPIANRSRPPAIASN